MKAFNRNVDDFRLFGFDYAKWPKGGKRINAVVWTPCVSTTVNASSPDEWVNLISRDGKEIHEMYPPHWDKAKCNRHYERCKYQVRIVFAHSIGSSSERRYRFIGLFRLKSSDTTGLHFKRLDV